MARTSAQVQRSGLLRRLRAALDGNPGTILLGPRQCGKTTLAREFVVPTSPNYFDLENPRDLARLENPMTELERLRGIVVIDEVQRRPDLFPALRVLLDRVPRRARFLLLGSASLDLLRQASESLAGRVAIVSMAGFGLDEIGAKSTDRLWLRGGLPRSFLAPSVAASATWRRDYVQLLLERDVPQFASRIPPTALHRFWSMVAHSHGGIWSSSGPAMSLGIAESTVRRYLDLMTGLLMLRQLQPWHENLHKRQVKAPKVYVRDSGLLHHFLGIQTTGHLLEHPKMGASWEGFVVEQVLRCVRPDAHYFWATHGGAELDLLMFRNGQRLGVEIKRTDAPTMTRSMQVAIADLNLDAVSVVYPGAAQYALDEHVHVMPLDVLAGDGPASLFPSLSRRRKKPTNRP